MDNEITEEDFNKILDKRENEIYAKIFKKGGEIEDLMTDALKKRTTILYINSNIYFHSFFKIIKKIKENKNKYKKIRINNENNLNLFYNKLDEIIKISNYMLISIESMTKIEY